MSHSERMAYLAVGLDAGTTWYGMEKHGLQEVGIVAGWSDDKGTALATGILVDALLVYAIHRAHRRHPDAQWLHPGTWGLTIAKGYGGLKNLKLIMDQ